MSAWLGRPDRGSLSALSPGVAAVPTNEEPDDHQQRPAEIRLGRESEYQGADFDGKDAGRTDGAGRARLERATSTDGSDEREGDNGPLSAEIAEQAGHGGHQGEDSSEHPTRRPSPEVRRRVDGRPENQKHTDSHQTANDQAVMA